MDLNPTEHNKITQETWNKVASLYEDKFMNLDIYNESYDYFCESLINDNAKVLDIGCGPGNISKYLLSKKPFLNISGIDFAPNMIELARKNIPTGIFNVSDIRHINSIAGTFDGIVCGFCLPYLSQTECEKLFFDSYNMLTKNGLLYISFVEGSQEKNGFRTGSSGDKTFFYYHNLDKFELILNETGFYNFRIFSVDYKLPVEHEVHRIIIAQK